MNCLKTVLVLLCASSIFASDGNNKIFGARCQARCLAKSLCYANVPECNGSMHKSCIKPCEDSNFFKVKSCKAYCYQFKSKENQECRNSCKYLMKLYNQQDAEPLTGDNAQLIRDGNFVRPTAVNTTLTKTPKLMMIKWSYNNTKPAVFIVEARYFTENPFKMTAWEYLRQTRFTSVKVKPRSGTWCEYRIMAVQQDGVSDYSSPSPPEYVMPDRPSMPRDFKVRNMHIIKGKVSVQLAWRKPEKSDVPVHRYRIFWSRRLDEHTKELQSLRQHHKKIKGNMHSCTINALSPNTTYLFEIQAICHVKGRRLRSERVYLTTRTLEEEPKTIVPTKKKKKKIFMKKNNNKKPIQLLKVKTTQSSYEALFTQSITVERTTKNSTTPVHNLKARKSSTSHTIKSNCLWFVTTVILIIALCQQ